MPNNFKHSGASQVVISELMLPSHSNFSGKIHGGYILSLMDQVAFACASKHSQHYCVTASVDKVDFLNPIDIGELVTMKASVNFVGNSSMVVGIRVEAENITTGKTKHCNSSYFTMVAKDKSGNNVKVPGLILKTTTEVRRFIKLADRRKTKARRKEKFQRSEFVVEDYLDELKKYNVKTQL